MSQDRPNIVFILTDDQGPWALGSAGNDELCTPHLDSLAASGTRFANWFCTSPVCSPARASILTGRIPSQHGVHDWLAAGNSTCEPARDGELIEYLAGIPGYTDRLAAGGYRCAFSGKWHLGDCHHPQKGFTRWYAHAKGGGPYYNAPIVAGPDAVEPEPAYVTDVITDHALGFLEEIEGERPFYLGVHYTAPHSPWGREHHPSATYDDYHENCPFASVPDLPRHPWAAALPQLFESPAGRRGWLSGYYAAVTEMDRNVGRIMAALDERGLRKETLVIFTSDNGMNMGHHGLCGKGNASRPLNMYEESVKVPAVASHPGTVPAGVVCNEMMSHYDVMPTLLEYAGCDDPDADARPGISFAQLWRGGAAPSRDEVVAFEEYGNVRMIRTETAKYIHRFGGEPCELYDLATDPGEEMNLVDDPSRKPIRDELEGRLHDWFARYIVPGRDGSAAGVTGGGQIARIDGEYEPRFNGR